MDIPRRATPKSRLAGAAAPVLTLMALLALGSGAAEARMGAYDGIWNVTFATTAGTCSSGYQVPFSVVGSRVSSAGGGRVAGAVGRNGSVAVHVSLGASRASGGGRLGGRTGGGYWSGIISGDRCSGIWQATRG